MLIYLINVEVGIMVNFRGQEDQINLGVRSSSLILGMRLMGCGGLRVRSILGTPDLGGARGKGKAEGLSLRLQYTYYHCS